MLKKIWQKFKTWNLPTKLGIIISIVAAILLGGCAGISSSKNSGKEKQSKEDQGNPPPEFPSTAPF
jgi:PBP1b-binding outer membrane lipoprotein LpoB